MKTQTLILVTLLLAPLINCCGQRVNVRFDDLVSNPQDYQGQYVCTEGIRATGFEIDGLGPGTQRHGTAIYLTEPVVWLEGATVESTRECFTSETSPPFEFCRATVCGHFEYGGSYGHLGRYTYQLRGAGR